MKTLYLQLYIANVSKFYLYNKISILIVDVDSQ